MFNRLDSRNLNKFKKDIKEGSRFQHEILLKWLKSTNQEHLRWWDTGSDNKGKYLANKDVSPYPDYRIETIGLVEIQYAKPLCDHFFHIKHKKMLTCDELNANILMVNGYLTQNPLWTLIMPKQIRVLLGRCSLVNWHGAGLKESFRIPLRWLNWKTLRT